MTVAAEGMVTHYEKRLPEETAKEHIWVAKALLSWVPPPFGLHLAEQ